MKINQLLKKKVLILGFGLEGQAAFDFLRENNIEDIIVADAKDLDKFSDQIKEKIKNAKIFFGKDYLESIDQAEVIIKSPGIRLPKDALEKIEKSAIALTSLTNIFCNNAKGKIIGVTGTKGKSTTSSLVYSILKKAGFKVYLCGNIGNPCINYLKFDSPETYFVFEFSSHQLENLEKAPDFAIFTTFFPDHMDYYSSIDEYFKAKTNIFGENTAIFYNAKFEKIKKYFENKENAFAYNSREDFIKDNKLFISGKEYLSLSGLKLIGEHNYENVLGAVLLAKKIGIEDGVIEKAIKEFVPLGHRLEKFISNGIIFYDDSASVTPQTSIEAIRALGKNNIDTIILGGMDRGYDFSKLAEEVLEAGIKNVALFPDSGKAIWEAIEEASRGNKLPKKSEFGNIEDCAKWCAQKTEKGKICLLSPASPSYNLFKNFGERGEKFRKFLEKD